MLKRAAITMDGQRRWTDASGLLRDYGVALLVSLGVTMTAAVLLPYLDHANIVMLFLLAVIIVAAGYGRGPALLVAVLNVLSFNFVFVPPYFAFAFDTRQATLTFMVMLVVGLIVGQLTARFRYQARIARAREQRASHLYDMARELSGALMAEQVVEISQRCIEASFQVKASLLLPDERSRLQAPFLLPGKLPVDLAIAQRCFDHNQPVDLDTASGQVAALWYVPLKAPLRTRGVLLVAFEQPLPPPIAEQRRLLDTVAVLIAIALERIHFATVARDTLVKMEAERERSSLLAGLSHDLRTPMTALIGLAETLTLRLAVEQSPYQDSLQAIREQAGRMALMVDNLLDMARLQVGKIRLHKDWQSLEELVGAAVRTLEQPLRDHPLWLDLDPKLPLVNCDAVLIERVLVNLLQNAAKYTPPGTAIGITAGVDADRLCVEVWDEGPGLPTGQEPILFEKFTRGQVASVVPGVGLGLAICRSIVEAHGGTIRAENRAAGGARFAFALPLEPPPPFETEDESDSEPDHDGEQ